MIGALAATFIYQNFGFFPIALTAVVFNIFALLALAELTGNLVILPRILAWLRRPERSDT